MISIFFYLFISLASVDFSSSFIQAHEFTIHILLSSFSFFMSFLTLFPSYDKKSLNNIFFRLDFVVWAELHLNVSYVWALMSKNIYLSMIPQDNSFPLDLEIKKIKINTKLVDDKWKEFMFCLKQTKWLIWFRNFFLLFVDDDNFCFSYLCLSTIKWRTFQFFNISSKTLQTNGSGWIWWKKTSDQVSQNTKMIWQRTQTIDDRM